MRRRALLQTAALTLVAGCSGGDRTDTPETTTGNGADTDPTTAPTTTTEYEHTMVTVGEDVTRSPTPTPTGSVPGRLTTDGWSAETLVGDPDPAANTLSVQGSITNETGGTATPTAARYDFLDDGETVIAEKEKSFFVEREVPPSVTFSLDQTLEFSSTDVTRIASMAVGLETEE
jgi:hypothetical protein